MDKFSGIILDVYDDLGGAVLKTIFPTAEYLPAFVKSAHAISSAERSGLPDDAFALILEQDGHELRKFATIDAGNTALSVEYFLKTAHKLPAEAQKVAAQNLVAACGWYGIEAPEELQKVADGVRKGIKLLANNLSTAGKNFKKNLPGVVKRDIESARDALSARKGLSAKLDLAKDWAAKEKVKYDRDTPGGLLAQVPKLWKKDLFKQSSAAPEELQKVAFDVVPDKVKWQKTDEQKRLVADRVTKQLQKAKKLGLLTPEGEETLSLGHRSLGDDYGITSHDVKKVAGVKRYKRLLKNFGSTLSGSKAREAGVMASQHKAQANNLRKIVNDPAAQTMYQTTEKKVQQSIPRYEKARMKADAVAKRETSRTNLARGFLATGVVGAGGLAALSGETKAAGVKRYKRLMKNFVKSEGHTKAFTDTVAKLNRRDAKYRGQHGGDWGRMRSTRGREGLEEFERAVFTGQTKAAATGVERLGASAEEVGRDWEGKGKTIRNVGYGGAAALGAGSFLPKSKAVRVAMRVGAAAGALGGLVGEGGVRTGRGYQRAGRELQGLPVNPHDEAGLSYSPSAYNQVHRAGEFQRRYDALEKVAIGVGTAIGLTGTAMALPGAVGETRSNMQKQRAFQAQTGLIATPNQLAGM